MESDRLQPRYTYTLPAKEKDPNEVVVKQEIKLESEMEAEQADEEAEEAEEGVKETSRCGRTIKRITMDGPAKRREGGRRVQRDNNESLCPLCGKLEVIDSDSVALLCGAYRRPTAHL